MDGHVAAHFPCYWVAPCDCQAEDGKYYKFHDVFHVFYLPSDFNFDFDDDACGTHVGIYVFDDDCVFFVVEDLLDFLVLCPGDISQLVFSPFCCSMF